MRIEHVFLLVLIAMACLSCVSKEAGSRQSHSAVHVHSPIFSDSEQLGSFLFDKVTANKNGAESKNDWDSWVGSRRIVAQYDQTTITADDVWLTLANELDWPHSIPTRTKEIVGTTRNGDRYRCTILTRHASTMSARK